MKFLFKPLDTMEEWLWFKDKTHVLRCEDSQGIMAYNEQGIIQAAAIFDSFSPDGCSVHWAIENPMVLRHKFLQAIAYHLFVTCKRERIFGLVPSNNTKALKFDHNVGMREVARIPHAMGEGIDYIIMTMTKAECRWLPEELREAA